MAAEERRRGERGNPCAVMFCNGGSSKTKSGDPGAIILTVVPGIDEQVWIGLCDDHIPPMLAYLKGNADVKLCPSTLPRLEADPALLTDSWPAWGLLTAMRRWFRHG